MTPEEAKRILERSVVTAPGINLQSGEVCYFAEEAAAIVAKNQNVGTTYSSFGSGLYGHGIGLHANQGVRNIVRGTVVDQYAGHLYLTSRRIVLVSYKAGFDIALAKLTGLDFFQDGLMVTAAGKSYLVSLKSTKQLKQVIEASNLYLSTAENGTQDAASVSKANVSAPSTIPMTSAADGKPKALKASVGLWIGFVLTAFLAIFSLRKPIQFNFFLMFTLLAAGFLLHLDPLHLRAQKKMLPASLTWIICIVLAIAAGLLL